MGYLRHPSISGDTIAFTCDDDIWVVSAEGGQARRLTAGHAESHHPQLSPDGTQLAFVSNDEGAPEVWLMPAVGGEATRVTYFGAPATSTLGWKADGTLLVASDIEQPFANWTMAYAVDKTGAIEPLGYGTLKALSYEPDGSGVVITRDYADPARWKRYRGGTAGKIWVDRKGDGSFKRILIDNSANHVNAMWVAGRIYFISDTEGYGNLYSTKPDGKDLRRHTDHGEYYARLASTDGARIVYMHAADIWVFDPATDNASKVEIEAGGGSTQRRRRYLKGGAGITGMAIQPKGTSALIEKRGQLVDLPLWEQAPRVVAPADGTRQRLASYLPDGESIVTVADLGGDEQIVVHPLNGAVTMFPVTEYGDIWELVAAPVGDPLVAIVNQRHQLFVLDLTNGKSTLLDTGQGGDLDAVSWSPDGRFVAYAVARNRWTKSIAICAVDSGRVIEVTKPEFKDAAPAWDPSGKFLYFTSTRYLDPVPDEIFFDLNFPRSHKVFVVALQAGEPSPFDSKPRPMKDEPPTPGNDAKPAKEGKGKKADVEESIIIIDAADIDRRVVAVPLPAGLYAKLLPIADALLVVASEVRGLLDRDIFGEDGERHSVLKVAIPSGKCDQLLTDVSDIEISTDGSTMLIKSGDKLRALPAGAKPPSKDEAGEGPSRASGWIDLDRVRLEINPPAEWAQLFREAWRLQRELFWDAGMSGIDWQRVHDRYAPLLEKLGTRADLSDLMWELQGELGTSHAYEIGGDRRKPEPWNRGFLGADLSPDKFGWKIDRIVKADSWDPESSSPLEAPGLDIAEGDVITAVNGRNVDASRTVGAALVQQAGAFVELTVADSRGRKPRIVAVKTLKSETSLRYRAWVEDRRRYVHEATDGAAGYIHVPDMGTGGYAEFHRSYLAEVWRDGLIVDVRENRGGFVSQLLLEKLSRKRIGYDLSRDAPLTPYPEDSPSGPMVAVTNENAGSDGDIFSHCWKLMELGPLVGMRTWGGVIGINGRHRLTDGTVTTQPEFSFWFNDVGYGVENYGTDPDVVIDRSPQDWATGADPQLDKALALLKVQLKKHKPLLPGPDRPSLALPVLPPRP